LDLLKENFEGQSKQPTFFVTLTHEATEIRKILRLWDESGDRRNPFAHLIFTPLFSKPATIATIRQLKDQRGSTVMFDSGGYQVQTGKATYEELFERLLRFYRENDWADFYVLPDHVPRSSDSDREVDFKVRETVDFARLFLKMMPSDFAAKAVGVVHGRTFEQVRYCVQAYVDMGISYIGFGSFGTSGPNGKVNMLSQKSLRLLKLVQTLACEFGLRLHIFGIGSPSHLIRLQQGAIVPDSFDSAGWWKAGGFGNIFFPAGRQLHITAIPNAEATLLGIERQKRHSGHQCPFCDNSKLLRLSRVKRILHNLAAMLDTLKQVYGGQ
ncbi:MAG: GNAT family N-acetyltransferase, partial [Armatimonadetes bacterium]|nr:GNAT family N-acetyltransferase [Armatimonadota bacterium]MDW8029827.1 GNAT family N-acetyltransferase [Armatimonadota bacterium]